MQQSKTEAQKSSHLSFEALEALANRLPYNYVHQARKRLPLKYDRSTIYRVRTGQIHNERILNVLFELAEEEDIRREENNQRAIGNK